MKPALHFPCGRRLARAFTLPELMIASTVFVLTIGGVIAAQYYGLRAYRVVSLKLGASDDARVSTAALLSDIRSAAGYTNSIVLGSGTATAFTALSNNAAQTADALRIFNKDPFSYPNSWVMYYYETNSNTLRRKVYGSSDTLVMANLITNDVRIFSGVDYAGNISQNNFNIASVLVQLKFTKVREGALLVGPLADKSSFYELTFCATCRATR